MRLDVAPPSKKWRDFFTPDEFSELNLTTSEATHQEVVFEIIRTEADYLADLKLVHKVRDRLWSYTISVSYCIITMAFTFFQDLY